MSLEEKINYCRERDNTEVLRLQDELDRAYKFVPDALGRVTKLTGIDPELLVKLCYEVAWHNNKRWYEVLDTISMFYVVKQRMEQEGS